MGSDADTHLATSSLDLGLDGSTSALAGSIMGMVGHAIHALGYALPFQYVSCSLPITGPAFSCPVYVPDVPTVRSLSVYRGSSQHVDHLVDEPTDVESELDGDGNDNDEYVDESVSSFLVIPLGLELCIILKQPKITSSLDVQADTVVNRDKDTPVRISTNVVAGGLGGLTFNMEVPTNVATS